MTACSRVLNSLTWMPAAMHACMHVQGLRVCGVSAERAEAEQVGAGM